MKTSALTLQHHLTNCMRLFAVMLLLTYTYTATAQTTDTLKPATTDKRWGIGVMVGTPDRTIAKNTNGSIESLLNSATSENNTKANYSLGFNLFKHIGSNRLKTSYIVTVNQVTGNISGTNTNGTYSFIDIKGSFYIHHIDIGYEFIHNINKISTRLFTGLSTYIYSKGQYDIIRKYKPFANLPAENTKETSLYSGGWGLGISAAPSVYYKISNSIELGFVSFLTFSYSKIGGSTLYKKYNTDTSEILNNDTYKFTNKGFLVSPVFLFSTNIYLTH